MQTGHVSFYKTSIKAPVEKVWDALINPDLVREYFFGSEIKGEWKEGGEIAFTGEYEGTSYYDKGVVQEFIPNKKLSYTYLSSWNNLEDIPENYLLVTSELQEVPEGTELTITQSNYDADKKVHSEQNWAIVIDGMKKLIE